MLGSFPSWQFTTMTLPWSPSPRTTALWSSPSQLGSDTPWHLKASHPLQVLSFWFSQRMVSHPWPLFPAGTLSTALPAAPSRLKSESLPSMKLPGSSPCSKAGSTCTHLGLPAWISFSSLGGRLCYLMFQVLYSEALEFKHRAGPVLQVLTFDRTILFPAMLSPPMSYSPGLITLAHGRIWISCFLRLLIFSSCLFLLGFGDYFWLGW